MIIYKFSPQLPIYRISINHFFTKEKVRVLDLISREIFEMRVKLCHVWLASIQSEEFYVKSLLLEIRLWQYLMLLISICFLHLAYLYKMGSKQSSFLSSYNALLAWARAGSQNWVTQRFKKDSSIKASNLLKMPNFEKH